METRRINFRRMMRIGGLGMVFLFGLGLIAASPGCIPGSVSGDSADSGTTTVTTGLACSQAPTGCLCADRAEQPDDLNVCNRASVATHTGERGVCCSSTELCTCEAFACRSDSSTGFCQCGPTIAFPATLAGAAIDACPASAGQKCCLATDTRVCTCSGADCEGGAMVVSSCTLDTVSLCLSQQDSPTSCK